MKLRTLPIVTFALLCTFGSVAHGQQYTVDRVAAVVGDKPILLSTVRRRARPFIVNMERTVTEPAERLIASAKVYRQLLVKLVAEELIAKAAREAKVKVQNSEVDRALDEVAKQNGMSRNQLLAEVQRTAAMSESEYRLEIERQILEYKMLNQLRQQQPSFASEDELRALHKKLTEEGTELPSFEAAREQLMGLHWQQRLAELRDKWLVTLRRHTYVEVRWTP